MKTLSFVSVHLIFQFAALVFSLVVDGSWCSTYDMSHKGLTDIPTDIPDNVTEVNLFSNRITKVPPNIFSHLGLCRNLYLLWNSITTIEKGAFNGLVQLTYLSLRQNLMKSLESGVLSPLESLRTLVLTENHISTIEKGALVGPMLLTGLKLTGNLLTELPDHGHNETANIIGLDIENNALRFYPRMFKNFTELMHLRFGNRALTELDGELFEGLSKLGTLEVVGCSFARLQSKVFKHIPHLWSLSLSQNKISLIDPEAFEGLNNLARLNLENNPLTTLDASVLEVVPRPLFLTISGAGLKNSEKLRCDQRLCWLKHEVVSGSVTWNGPWDSWRNPPVCADGEDFDEILCGGKVCRLEVDMRDLAAYKRRPHSGTSS